MGPGDDILYDSGRGVHPRTEGPDETQCAAALVVRPNCSRCYHAEDRRTSRRQETTATSSIGYFARAVKAAIDYKFVTVGVAVALFVASLMLPVGSEFFPQDLRDQFAIEVWLPENVAIAETDKAAQSGGDDSAETEPDR